MESDRSSGADAHNVLLVWLPTTKDELRLTGIEGARNGLRERRVLDPEPEECGSDYHRQCTHKVPEEAEGSVSRCGCG
jgi:hypothetical protein